MTGDIAGPDVDGVEAPVEVATGDATAPVALESPPPLLDQIRARLRVKHCALRAERAYVGWVRRFILFHGKRHPRELGAAEGEAFLTHLLAVDRSVSASTQNQARSALLFLYREVLAIRLPWLDGVFAAC